MKFLTSGFFLSTIKSRDQLHFRLRSRNNVSKILKITFPVDFTRYFRLSEEQLVLKDESIEYQIHSLIIKRCQKFCHSFRYIWEIQRLRSMLQCQFRVKTIQTDGTFLILFGPMTWPYRGGLWSNNSYDLRVIFQSGLRSWFLGGRLVQTLPEILQRGQTFWRTDRPENLE